MFAQEDLQEFALDDMVVTATRTESKMVDVPVNATVISAEKIADRHYLDVADALKDVPGANVLDTGKGAYEKKLVLNGDERVLVLVDGRRVNNEMGSTSGGRASFDFNQLPDVSLVERIEVVKGHGGALYGSDAVGGVVIISSLRRWSIAMVRFLWVLALIRPATQRPCIPLKKVRQV